MENAFDPVAGGARRTGDKLRTSECGEDEPAKGGGDLGRALVVNAGAAAANASKPVRLAGVCGPGAANFGNAVLVLLARTSGELPNPGLVRPPDQGDGVDEGLLPKRLGPFTAAKGDAFEA